MMNSTYCDKTGDHSYALHMNESELGLIADLLNSVNDLRAVPLRQAVDQEIRAQNAFIILRERRIIQCDYCKGSGSIRSKNFLKNEWIKEPCPKCLGKCQKVAITTTRYEMFTPFWANELIPEK